MRFANRSFRLPHCVRALSIAALALLAGCAARDGLTRARLDGGSGITVVTATSPLVFARAETRYSRSQRDYLYLGPVETNRQGTREYYLWIGAGTTLDRGYLAPPDRAPERVYVDIGGEPMELELKPWRERVPSIGDDSVYATPVRVAAELAARVTLDQLERLAREPLESLRVVGGDGREQSYFRWNAGGALAPFLAAVGAKD